MSKITKATFKSFLKKNQEIYINVKSTFDGMVDGCVSVKNGFEKAVKTDYFVENTCGFEGIYLVNGGRGRDRFRIYDDGIYKGFEVYNCCGSFIVAIK